MKNKIICMLLVCITLLGLYLPIYATEATEPVVASSAAAAVDMLDHSVYLSSDEVLDVIEARTRRYLDSDTATRGTTFKSEFIPMNDTDGNLFAYMVPMVLNGREVGYVSTGARRDAFTVFEIYFNEDTPSAELDIARSIIQRADAMTDTLNEAEIIFYPPMSYYIKETTPDTEAIFSVESIQSDEDPEDVSAWFKENAAEAAAVYDALTDNDTAEVDELLAEFNSLADSAPPLIIDTRIQREWLENLPTEQRFVPIYDGNTYYYGGAQSWFTDPGRKNVGCGPTAFANLLAYLKMYHEYSWYYTKLYAYSNFSKVNFTAHMNTIYDALTPGVIGNWDFNEAVRRIQGWSEQTYGVKLAGYTITSKNKGDYETLINNAVYQDYPVVIVNLHPPRQGNNFDWHYVTITKFYRAEGGEKWIAVSSWGERHSLDWDTYFTSISSSFGGAGYVM